MPKFHPTQPANHTGPFAFPPTSPLDYSKHSNPSYKWVDTPQPLSTQPKQSDQTHFQAHPGNPNSLSRPDPAHNFSSSSARISHSHLPNNSALISTPPTEIASPATSTPSPSDAHRHLPHNFTSTPNQPPFPSSARFNSFNRRPNISSRPEYPRLFQSEIQTHIAQGLCFKCGGKFRPNHQCPFKQLRLMLYKDDEQDVTEFPEDNNQPELRPGDEVELSRHSVAGINSPKTLKFLDKIRNSSVVILVDSDAFHSFISQQLVVIGNGSKVIGGEICPGVKLQLLDMHFFHDYYVFPLGNVDVILGVDWLATFGIIRTDWQNLPMVFHWGGQKITIQGDLSLVTQEASLKAFRHLFEEPSNLPPRRTHDHAIRLFDGIAPPNVRPYRYPHHQKNEIERQVHEMLHAGIIQPNHSPFSCPVLLVQKKDGGWRFCVDYRALNKITVPDKFPIPIIDELLDELVGSTIFTKLDLKSSYHQIRIVDSDIEKTTFRTPDGHYEFLVMPFGLSNAPATFQALMNEVFRAHLRQFILVFFDYILIYSRDLTAHLDHLNLALQLLSNHHLLLNKKKCSFGVSRLEYLGHLISAEGVAANPQKIQCMIDWPRPRDITALCGFLGLTGYYRRFVPHYGQIAAPLTQLLKKNSFHWNEDSTVAFERLKAAMTTVPVLAMPDFTQPL
ncbi:uncharacterized protein LOC123208541 [Mangifera indica]|uniref:uncharacterized protein LOC123208541 n=1 Tax=Mangifera indica TaxID=29780 RepID=UPI001CFA63FC|nr:uncharacterized protein LOC123208541 [Mangifera indica]